MASSKKNIHKKEPKKAAEVSFRWRPKTSFLSQCTIGEGFAKRLGSWLVAAAGLALVVYGGSELYGFVRTTPHFALKQVVVDGNSRLAEEEIVDALGLSISPDGDDGSNLFTIDVQELEERVRQNAWVRKVHIRKALPRRLFVDVKEYEAVASIALDATYCVDSSGLLFACGITNKPLDVPVITGVDATRFYADTVYRKNRVRQAKQIVQRYFAARLEKQVMLEELHYDEAEGWMLYFEDQLVVQLGSEAIDGRLLTLEKVLQKLAKLNRQPARIFLNRVNRHDQVVVRFRES